MHKKIISLLTQYIEAVKMKEVRHSIGNKKYMDVKENIYKRNTSVEYST